MPDSGSVALEFFFFLITTLQEYSKQKEKYILRYKGRRL